MCDKKDQENKKPIIAQGSTYDFWLNEDDDNYDKKYGEK